MQPSTHNDRGSFSSSNAHGEASCRNATRPLLAGLPRWAAAGDVVGVGQSGYNLATGQFTAMDLLGFAPTIGWAMGAARGLRGYSQGIAVQRGLGSQGVRNSTFLTSSQQDEVMRIVGELGLNPKDIHVSHSPSAYKKFADFDYIQIGPNAVPLESLATTGNTFERLTLRSAIAHEAGHMISTRAGKGFPAGSFEDEVIANIYGRQLPSLNTAERYQLLRYSVELARQGQFDLRTFLNGLE